MWSPDSLRYVGVRHEETTRVCWEDVYFGMCMHTDGLNWEIGPCRGASQTSNAFVVESRWAENRSSRKADILIQTIERNPGRFILAWTT
jgi:hypothetical protein